MPTFAVPKAGNQPFRWPDLYGMRAKSPRGFSGMAAFLDFMLQTRCPWAQNINARTS